MKNSTENSKQNEPGRFYSAIHWLFKKKYSARYNSNVWVFDPFAFLSTREKANVI